MKTAPLSVLIILFFNVCFAQQEAKGIVFYDKNANGKKEKNEEGIPNVLVSNGAEIVSTNNGGQYEIGLDPGQILFIVKPKGWMTQVNELNLPQFHYIHKPDGSPKLSIPGSEPTGDLPLSIDFPLRPSEEPTQFEVFIFGDPQPGNKKHIQFLAADVISEVVGDTVRKFGISLGDIVSDNLQDYSLLNTAFAQIGMPWYNIAGNHDINYDADEDRNSDETFERTFGPATYAFQYADVHFILLDNVIFNGEKNSGGKPYIGGIRKDQFTFIENYLSRISKEDLIVLAVHIPLFQRQSPKYKNEETFRSEDLKRLFELLQGFPNTLSLSGHTHFQKQYFFDGDDGWKGKESHHHFNMGTSGGDWFKGLLTYDGFPDATMRDGTPNGYGILKIDDDQYDIAYKVTGASLDKQISLSIDSVSHLEKMLFANFYVGNEYSNVFAQFNTEDKWRRMNATYEPDPRTIYMHHLMKDQNSLGSQVSTPHSCTHLWKLPIPKSLTRGYHLVKVKAVDRQGKNYYESLVFKAY